MPTRMVQRSAALAACLTLLTSGLVAADTISADADIVRPSAQTFIDLGTVAPGSSITVQVGFILMCRNLGHVDPGTVITLTPGTPVKPADGRMTATPVTIGPVPADWPADGEPCLGDPELTGSQTSTVVVGAPPAGGQTYTYSMPFDRSPSDGLTGGTAVGFRLTVPTNSAPTIDVPADFSVEGDTAGGWTAAYSVGTTDAEDTPDPAATCAPTVGALVPLGQTAVTCSVTDSGGLSARDSFVVTVEDTVAPALADVPGDRTLVATGSSGAVVTFATPTAADVVDATPTVGCSPASGSTFPIGSTTVTCTASDDSGNASSATFVVTVTAPQPSHQVRAIFDEPVGANGVMTGGSRTIPVKVRLFRDGSEVTSGSAWLWIGPCGGDASGYVELDRQGHRWMAHVDTGRLAAGCYQVTARSGGQAFGGFELRVDMESSTAQAKPKKKS